MPTFSAQTFGAQKFGYPRRGLVAGLFAALLLQLLVFASPAQAVVISLSSTDALRFDRTRGVTNIVGTGTAAGNIVLYQNVGSFSGLSIDAVITTVAVNGSISNYDNPGSASTSVDAFQINTVGGETTFRISFYEAGTYTGLNTGVPVTLQNLHVTSIDLDSSSSAATYQYSEFTGFQRYSLTNPTNLAVQPLSNPSRVRFVATKTGMRSSVPEDQAMVVFDSVQTFAISVGNVTAGQTNYFGLFFGPWPGTGTPVEYANVFNTPPTSTDATLNYASGVPTVLPLTAFGSYSDSDGNPFYQVRITTLPASGSLEYFNGTAWTAVTLNQLVLANDITQGRLRYTGTTNATLGFAVNDSQDFSVVSYTLSLNVAGAAQTITFSNPGTETAGATFASGASSDSGETVTLTSLTPGVCTVSGLIITTLANGTCSIVATQPGNSTYGAATPVTQTFPVSSNSSQVITFANPGTKTTANSPVASGATSSSGLTVSLTSLTSSVCTVSGLNIVLLTQGNCTIRATQAGGVNGATTYAAAVPVEQTFLVSVGAPTAITSAASAIASTSATINGSINGFGASTTAQFCLSTSSASTGGIMNACTVGAGRVSAVPATVTASGTTAVSYAAAGLTTGATYYFQVIATSGSGTTYGSVLSFRPVAVLPPTATTWAPTYSSSSRALLNGTVSANGDTASVTFCYSTSSAAVNASGALSSCTSRTATTTPTIGPNATSTTSYRLQYSSSTYYYQVVATNSAGTTYGQVLKFTKGAPYVATVAADSFTASSANLKGTVRTPGSTTVTASIGFCMSESPNVVTGILATCLQSSIASSSISSTAKNFNSVATGLNPGQTYWFQARATITTKSIGYTNYGQVLSFTMPAAAPTVRTIAASAVLANGATLNGEVNANLNASLVSFCYGTAANLSGCTTETATPGSLSGSSDAPVSLVLSNLSSLTKYYFRASAKNNTGTTNGLILSFTTGGPVAITTAATGVSGSGATLNGAVKAQGVDTVNNGFCYGNSPSVTAGVIDTCTVVAATQATSTGYGATPISVAITGLTGGTTYYFQTVASRSSGGTTYYAYGDVLTFIAADVPVVTTVAVTGVGPDTATLKGTITANGAVTTASFCYATSSTTTDGILDGCANPAYTLNAIQSPLGANAPASTTITGDIFNLAPGTTYYYQAVGENSRGTVYGAILSFVTGAAAPTATTLAASAAATTAILNGTINANGGSTAVKFCYSTSQTLNGNGSGAMNSCTAQPAATPTPVSGNSAVAVAVTITGLTAGTTYYYQVIGTNSAGTSYGAVMSVTVGAPSVVTQAATSVTSTSALLNGTAARNGSNITSISFCYGTAADLTGCTAVTVFSGSLATDTATAYTLTGLSPGLAYYFQIQATNGRGTSLGDILSFTTGAPTAITTAATSVTATGATLNGTINSNGGDATTPSFCYGTSASATDGILDVCTSVSGGADVTGSSTTSITASLVGLSPNTIYYFQIYGDTNLLSVAGQIRSFTTPAAAPTAATNAATSIAAAGATLNGTVNPGGASTTVRFCYGTASDLTGCTTVAAAQSPMNDVTELSASAAVTGLTAGTLYYFRVIATNITDTATGSILSFTTAALAPTVSTDTATAVGQTSATINGTVNAGGDSTAVTFCWGTASDLAGCATVTASQSPVSGNGNSPVSFALSGLAASTTYYFRASASNSAGGPTNGIIRSFTTSALTTYTLTLHANGGSPATDTQTVTHGASETLKANPFTRTGYHFAGWDTSVLGTTVVYGNGGTAAFTSASDLYAVWAVDTFTVTASAGANGSITPSGVNTVNYGSTDTITVTADSGYHVASVTVDSNPATLTDGMYVFTNVTANHTISVTFAIDTFTVTASAGANGSITPSGVNVVDYGSTDTITVTAAAGYHVDTVTVDGDSAVLVSGAYVFTNITANHTITVTFAIDTYTVTASAGSHGSVTPDGITTVDYGSTDTITVTADAGYHVDTVTVDGDSAVLVSGAYVFTNITTNHTITVTFAIDTFTVTATTGANGSITPSGVNTVNYGSTDTITVTADSGYHVASLTVDSEPAVLTAGVYVFTNITTNHTISVTFAIDTFTVTASAGANGSITPSGAVQVDTGLTETFTVTADTGYHVASVTVDSEPAVLTAGVYVFTNITTNHTISVTFAIDTFTVTASAGANGSITPSGVNTVNYGSTDTITVTADAGYHVASVTVDSEPAVLTAGVYVFTNITTNHTISVTFAIDTYTVTFSPNGGTGSMDALTVEHNVASPLPANGFTRTGHNFAGWSLTAGGVVAYTDTETAAFTESVTLYAVWALNSFVISFVSNGGTGTMPEQVVEYGIPETLDSSTFTRSGFTFAGWALTANGSVVYTNGQTVTPAAALTLYAIWSPISVPPTPPAPTPPPTPAFDPRSVSVETTTVIGTSPGDNTPRGLPVGALIQVSPTLLPTVLGIATAEYKDGHVIFVATPTFSGVTLIPLEIIIDGVTNIVWIPVRVDPRATQGEFVPQTAAQTRIQWIVSPNAVSYVVTINGKVACETQATSCLTAQLIGPATSVTLTVLGNDGTQSTRVLAVYAPERPIVVTVVRFAENSAKLTAVGVSMLKKLVKLARNQGFTRIVINGYTDAQGGRQNASALSLRRAKAVAQYLRKFLRVAFIQTPKGLLNPVAPNDTKFGQALNRRATIAIW